MSELKIESEPVPKDLRSALYNSSAGMEIGEPEAYILEADGDTLHVNGVGGIWRIFRDREYVDGSITRELAFAMAQKLHDDWLKAKS